MQKKISLHASECTDIVRNLFDRILHAWLTVLRHFEQWSMQRVGGGGWGWPLNFLFWIITQIWITGGRGQNNVPVKITCMHLVFTIFFATLAVCNMSIHYWNIQYTITRSKRKIKENIKILLKLTNIQQLCWILQPTNFTYCTCSS